MLRLKIERNQLGRDFVCGDLHGTYERLEDVMKFVNFDTSKDRMFSVGDLVDRGPSNEKCLRLLNEDWFYAVRGNHEQLMSDFYTRGPYGMFWGQNGGRWGFAYTEQADDTDAAKAIRDLAKKASELPVMMTVERQDGKFFHVIHAELAVDGPLYDSDLDDEAIFREITEHQSMDGDFVLWGRYIFAPMCRANLIGDPARLDKIRRGLEFNRVGVMFNENLSHIYSGHSIVQVPTRYKGQTNLDTCAFGSVKRDGGLAYSTEPTPEEWCGLTITEPLTDRFWTATYHGVKEVSPLIV